MNTVLMSSLMASFIYIHKRNIYLKIVSPDLGKHNCCVFFHSLCSITVIVLTYHRDSRQEFEKVGGIFPILHVVFLLDASN